MSSINPATALTDRINALTVYPDTDGQPFLRLDQVLAVVKGAVPVEIDPDMYPDVQDVTDRQRGSLAVVSTAYNLLADKAAEFADQDTRKRAVELGVEMAATAEVFAENKDNPDPAAIRSYHDLAHHSERAVDQLVEILTFLTEQSVRDATLGLLMSGLNSLHFEGGEEL